MASRPMRIEGMMLMFVRFGFDSRGFDSVPRLVRAAASSQQGQNEEDPQRVECQGVFQSECGPMSLLCGCLPLSPNVSTRASTP